MGCDPPPPCVQGRRFDVPLTTRELAAGKLNSLVTQLEDVRELRIPFDLNVPLPVLQVAGLFPLSLKISSAHMPKKEISQGWRCCGWRKAN
jgi:hypothetical protein